MKSAPIILTWLTAITGGICLLHTIGPLATLGVGLIVWSSELRRSWIG